MPKGFIIEQALDDADDHEVLAPEDIVTPATAPELTVETAPIEIADIVAPSGVQAPTLVEVAPPSGVQVVDTQTNPSAVQAIESVDLAKAAAPVEVASVPDLAAPSGVQVAPRMEVVPTSIPTPSPLMLPATIAVPGFGDVAPAPRKRGRPLLSEQPLSKLERNRRYRQSHATVSLEIPGTLAARLREAREAMGLSSADLLTLALDALARQGGPIAGSSRPKH